MRTFRISKASASGLWEEAEICGMISKTHHNEYISREYTCSSGKDVYLTYEKATKALRMRTKREKSKEVYKCHICGHYHLTTKNGEDRRAHAYSRNREREYDNQTRLMLSDKRIMQAARALAPQIFDRVYVVSMNRDLLFT